MVLGQKVRVKSTKQLGFVWAINPNENEVIVRSHANSDYRLITEVSKWTKELDIQEIEENSSVGQKVA